jgi:GrpB-like predicted nucleotidyltransferase (UPF0157 family)
MEKQQTIDGNYWKEQFDREYKRLINALGEVTDGGIIERMEHIGATSVPGLFGRPCVDIALAVVPFPLDETVLQELSFLGYEVDPDFIDTQEQHFLHLSSAYRLYVVEAGSPLWTDFVLIREYLCHNEAVRQALSTSKQAWGEDNDLVAYQQAKKQWFDELLENAHRSWIEHERFAPVQFVVEELRDFPCFWHISGGWALDIFLGRVTRVHYDVDVEISRTDQLVLQQYMTERGWKLLTPFEGRLQRWPMHMRLEMPRHQVHAHRSGAFIDFLLADHGGGIWRYRREPAIIRDLDIIGLHSDEGIPFLAPELVLLFKNKTSGGKERSKDKADFEKTYTSLKPESRAWLRWALIATDPSHPWIERLK